MQGAVDNKRVAKNAVVLYFRMLFQMVVYLYTSRVVISTLGIVDYGIFDVVAGVVGVLVFLNNSMATCTQRFITFAIGRNDAAFLNQVYSGGLLIHVLLALAILLVGETAGLWYVHHYMVLPPERFHTALTVYHCSLFSAMCMMVSVPYNATIIAYERMTAFAGITIMDVLLKLGLVLSLPYLPGDKLKTYALGLAAESLLVRLVYGTYCKLTFRHMKIVKVRQKGLLKEMMGFAGWSTFGNFALVCNAQGLNLVLNWAGGPLVNAARAAAFQVQTAITAFTASFQTAVNPQITKTYAGGNNQEMNRLILHSSKLSFFLLLFIVIPLGLEMDDVLRLWLTRVPPHAAAFTRLLLCVALVDALANPMMVGAAATGRIRLYHIAVGTTLFLALPLAIGLTHWLGAYEWVFVAQLLMALCAQGVRMYLCRSLYAFSVRDFVREVLWPIARVLFLALPLCVGLHTLFSGGFAGVVLMSLCTTVVLTAVVYGCGLTPSERNFLLSKIRRRV